MLIIQVAGGLGNQMQQYAMYRKLLHIGKDVKLDLSWFSDESQKGLLAPRSCELKLFNKLPMEVCTEEERDRFLKKSLFRKISDRISPESSKIFMESKMYHPEVFDMDDKYLQGFFLCQKYYDDIMPELRKAFVFPEHTDTQCATAHCAVKNARIAEEMRSSAHSVSVHIRRGDYITDAENQKLFGNITTDKYYEAAMQYFLEKDSDTVFYIFSNDTEYVRKKYSNPERYRCIDWNTGENSLLDMQLMSFCRGNICANSTFSFWGARLNGRQDKVLLRPLVMRNNQAADPAKMHDYWKGWILMDNQGNIV